MTRESLIHEDWNAVLEQLGGMQALELSARKTGAFIRPRKIKCAADLLRMTLAYCLSDMGLRLTAAWAAAVGLSDLSNVALLGRLRNMGPWLAVLVGQVLDAGRPKAAKGRLIRLIDATTVPKAGKKVRGDKALWRLHSILELPSERFGFLELTDQKGGERLDRAPVVKGEIRIGDRGYAQPDRMAAVIGDGGDVLIRSGWQGLRWLDEDGERLDIIAMLKAAEEAGPLGVVDRPILVGRKSGPPLRLRLVAFRKSAQAAERARRKARAASRKGRHQIKKATLYAAGWVILVTSLQPSGFSRDDIATLYRLRWRIELAYKRLKSLIGLKGPPGKDPRTAKAYILAHLLAILLIEPYTDELDDSPRWATA